VSFTSEKAVLELLEEQCNAQDDDTIGGRIGDMGSASRKLLEFAPCSMGMDYFGRNLREMTMRGQVTAELPSLMDHLRIFPGLRPVMSLPQALLKWHPGEVLPEEVQAALLVPSVRRDTTYVLGLDDLQVLILPSGGREVVTVLPELKVTTNEVEVRFSAAHGGQAQLRNVEFTIPGVGLPAPLVSLPSVDIARREGSADPALAQPEEPIFCDIPSLEVNLTAFVVMVLANHGRCYSDGLTGMMATGDAPPQVSSASTRASTRAKVRVRRSFVRVWDDVSRDTNGMGPQPSMSVSGYTGSAVSGYHSYLSGSTSGGTRVTPHSSLLEESREY
jgi:hypothetical protein